MGKPGRQDQPNLPGIAPEALDKQNAVQTTRRAKALERMALARASRHGGTRTALKLNMVKRFCLECSGQERKAVVWCPCDGVHSTRCEWWPYRFGISPGAFKRQYGPRLVTPSMMPPANFELDSLPALLSAASAPDLEKLWKARTPCSPK